MGEGSRGARRGGGKAGRRRYDCNGIKVHPTIQ